MRSLAWLLVPLLLLTMVPAGAAQSACLYRSAEGQAWVFTCDRSDDGLFDDHHVYVDATGTDVRAHTYQARQGDPRTTEAGVLVASGYPVAPVVWADLRANDRGSDGDQERIILDTGASGKGIGGGSVFLFADDTNNDALFTDPFTRVCLSTPVAGRCAVVAGLPEAGIPDLPSPWEVEVPEDPARLIPRPTLP